MDIQKLLTPRLERLDLESQHSLATILFPALDDDSICQEARPRAQCFMVSPVGSLLVCLVF
jgi:hypothetical protein